MRGQLHGSKDYFVQWESVVCSGQRDCLLTSEEELICRVAYREREGVVRWVWVLWGRGWSRGIIEAAWIRAASIDRCGSY